MDAAVAIYQHLHQDEVDPANVLISGDSADRDLVHALLLRLEDSGVRPGAAAVVMSAWTDLTTSGETMTAMAGRDPDGLARAAYGDGAQLPGGHDLQDPLVSPLFGDLSGRPPLLVQVCSEDVFLDDARRLTAAAHAAGGDAEHHGECISHLAALRLVFPEARASLDRIWRVRRHAPDGRRVITKAQAAVVSAPDQPFELGPVALGEPRDREVLVRIDAVGMSHADLAAGAFPFPLPEVLGHEGAGIVER